MGAKISRSTIQRQTRLNKTSQKLQRILIVLTVKRTKHSLNG